jgi:hypothetical protein
MRDRSFGMFGRHISMTGFAVLDGLLELLDTFVQVRILHIFLGRLCVLERPLCMLHEGIGMALLPMRHGFLRMFDRLTHMLIVGQGQPTE